MKSASRSAINAVFAILGTVNFAHLVNFGFEKVQKNHKNPNSEPLNVFKMSILAHLESPKLISRKI